MQPASTEPVTALRPGEYLLIDLARPGHVPETIGVVLLDVAADRAHVRFRRDWDEVAPEEADVLAALEEDMEQAARQMGAAAFVTWLEESLSNDLRTGDRERVSMASAEKTLTMLYRKHVPSQVRPFQTHLPLYSARAAATKFSEQQDVSSEGWTEVFGVGRLDENMFVCRVEGRSMEPKIPSGSWCIFRAGVTGSRQGRLVLVENRSSRGGETERYTIKQYWSEKSQQAEGWAHTRILLKPLNPDFEAWELDDSGRYAVIAEFVSVIDE